jgi:hypothetical protein
MKKETKISLDFNRCNLKHNRLWSQLVTLFVTLLTVISAFVISMFALSMTSKGENIILKEYIVLSFMLFFLLTAIGINTYALWENRKNLKNKFDLNY